MTFDSLEKTPEVAPLLVRLYDTHNLYAMAEKCDEQCCGELTSIMVDLLNIPLSKRESELIADVLLALMKKAEADLKVALSERLADMDSVPLRMILGLANDEPRVADAVLKQSPILQDLDLLYILHANGVEHGRAIAQRKGLGPAVINVLANTKDFDIAVNLSNNDGIKLTEHAFQIFADMAKDNEHLAGPLISRDDLPKDIAAQMFQFVGAELKKNLKDRYGEIADKAASVIDDIALEMANHVDIAVQDEPVPEALHMQAINQLRRGELNPTVLMASMRRGQPATFLAQCAAYAGLSIEKTKSMVREDGGRGLAVLCKAKNIGKPDFVSLYLMTERFRSTGRRAINHEELSKIMAMYDELYVEEARFILQKNRH